MQRIKLKKASFIIRTRSGTNEECIKTVRGYTLNYKGHNLGIYRKDCTTDKRRKYDYVLTDTATGLMIAVRARKLYIVEDLENDSCEYLQRYEQLTKTDFYARQVSIFNELKKGAF